MYSPEMRRDAVAEVARSSIAEVSVKFGISPSSVRRWVQRTDLTDLPRSGRPPIQSTANQVVEALVGTAGARISGKDYSTRALSDATGLSQSIVSRAMSAMTVPLGTVTQRRGGGVGGEVTVVAGGFPFIVVGIREVGSSEVDSGGVDAGGVGTGGAAPGEGASAGGEVDSVPARRVQRRVAGFVAALRSSGVQHWAKRFDSEHRQFDPAAMRSLLLSGGDRFLVFDPLGEVHGLDGHGLLTAGSEAPEISTSAPSITANVETRQSFEEFVAELKLLLAGCRDIPGSLLDLIAVRVRHGFEGVMWQASRHNETVKSFNSSDSMEISSWLPRETRSITEHLAIALREEIIDSGYQPGDRINPRLLSRRMEVPRSSVDAALRRMVDDELLDGSRGGARIPLITTVDVLDLYAARMAMGELLLRSLAMRPRRYFVPVQLALRQVEASAATRSGIDIENADLHFQQELARASGLGQSARAFRSLTLRLRLFISVLQLDYSPASDRILVDNRAIFKALTEGDADAAIRAWRSKVDNAVRHMAGLLARRRFDQDLWTQLTRRSE